MKMAVFFSLIALLSPKTWGAEKNALVPTYVKLFDKQDPSYFAFDAADFLIRAHRSPRNFTLDTIQAYTKGAEYLEKAARIDCKPVLKVTIRLIHAYMVLGQLDVEGILKAINVLRMVHSRDDEIGLWSWKELETQVGDLPESTTSLDPQSFPNFLQQVVKLYAKKDFDAARLLARQYVFHALANHALTNIDLQSVDHRDLLLGVVTRAKDNIGKPLNTGGKIRNTDAIFLFELFKANAKNLRDSDGDHPLSSERLKAINDRATQSQSALLPPIEANKRQRIFPDESVDFVWGLSKKVLTKIKTSNPKSFSQIVFRMQLHLLNKLMESDYRYPVKVLAKRPVPRSARVLQDDAFYQLSSKLDFTEDQMFVLLYSRNLESSFHYQVVSDAYDYFYLAELNARGEGLSTRTIPTLSAATIVEPADASEDVNAASLALQAVRLDREHRGYHTLLTVAALLQLRFDSHTEYVIAEALEDNKRILDYFGFESIPMAGYLRLNDDKTVETIKERVGQANDSPFFKRCFDLLDGERGRFTRDYRTFRGHQLSPVEEGLCREFFHLTGEDETTIHLDLSLEDDEDQGQSESEEFDPEIGSLSDINREIQGQLIRDLRRKTESMKLAEGAAYTFVAKLDDVFYANLKERFTQCIVRHSALPPTRPNSRLIDAIFDPLAAFDDLPQWW